MEQSFNKMKKYWIKDIDRGSYWCMTKMKPSDSEDKPSNYRLQGYWSKFNESYDIKKRVKYLWITAQVERMMMHIFGNINTSLQEVQRK